MRNIRMTGTLRGPFVILSRSSRLIKERMFQMCFTSTCSQCNLYCKSYIVRIKTNIDTPMIVK
ncbi:hypothetical protein T12_3876 [Trichinella patagoniensis]|uniref:Uncharacterized protein n=1 Tax=Trichinella patagoniensis TaxID=990121 RepID=A0A0V1AFL9_9BILA|nr:hypothetical protein T12_3876 [Trichinella patagoniensis]